jgi:hypothetical protein
MEERVSAVSNRTDILDFRSHAPNNALVFPGHWPPLQRASWTLIAVSFCSMGRTDIITLLEGGDRRSIGGSNRVAGMVSKNPRLFPKLIAGLWSADYLVRMRAGDAAEKVTRKNPELLSPYKKELLGLLTETKEQELRWHLAVMVPRLPLESKEKQLVISSLSKYLEDRSSIVKTFALQGLVDLAKDDLSIRATAIEILREATRNGTPAMKARSRRLLGHLERIPSHICLRIA